MKSFVAISLSILVFFQSLGFGITDVLLLNNLVEHAQYHSEEFGDDFYTFFEKHYGDLKAEHQKTQQEEKSQHEKLPFQHNHCNHLLADVIFTGFEFPLQKSIVCNTVDPHFFYQDLYSFLERAYIFQPPKIA